MVGSPFWMPPEMIKRLPYSYPVDIWSFAICLLELANGQPPNRKSSLKVSHRPHRPWHMARFLFWRVTAERWPNGEGGGAVP